MPSLAYTSPNELNSYLRTDVEFDSYLRTEVEFNSYFDIEQLAAQVGKVESTHDGHVITTRDGKKIRVFK